MGEGEAPDEVVLPLSIACLMATGELDESVKPVRYVRAERIEALEAERKKDCVAFFRWFWNQPGTNAEQAYDQWIAERAE